MTAIESVCNIPGGKHYGKPFEASMIPDLEPYLVVTEEMVIFSVSTFADQFRPPAEHKIQTQLDLWRKVRLRLANRIPMSIVWIISNYPKLKQLSKKINSRIPLEKGRTSINNIENFLLNMSKHTLKTKPYKDPWSHRIASSERQISN